MKILVCGGRDMLDADLVSRVLLQYSDADVHLIHGGARGADALAGQFARQHGWPVTVYPADWKRYGRSAGPKRNADMLEKERPDLVIAFPGGRGTADMVRRAREARVPVREASR